jgi:hypothetical protein
VVNFRLSLWAYLCKSQLLHFNVEWANYDSKEEKEDKFGVLVPKGNVSWSQKKIRGTFKHEWDVKNFPFDKHILEIPIEESSLLSSDFVYTPDTINSSFKENIKIDGWRIKKFSISEQPEKYETTFGDPGIKTGVSSYTRLIIKILVERDSVLSFLKIITGVYAAFGTMLLAFFMDPAENFGDRSALLVGSLFAVLVSMQSIEGTIGKSEALTMVDAIHITALIYILAAVIAALYSSRLCELGRPDAAIRYDRKICFSIFTISFVIFNAVMIINALLKG